MACGGGASLRDHRDGTPPCAPDGVSTYQTNWTNDTTPAPCGSLRWTWDETAKDWRQVLVPCPTTTTSVKDAETFADPRVFAGTLAVR
jgi:hypothetical protein